MASPVWYSQAPKANALFKMPGPSVFNADNGNLLQYITFVVGVGDQLVLRHDRLRATHSFYTEVFSILSLQNNTTFFHKSHYFTVQEKRRTRKRNNRVQRITKYWLTQLNFYFVEGGFKRTPQGVTVCTSHNWDFFVQTSG